MEFLARFKCGEAALHDKDEGSGHDDPDNIEIVLEGFDGGRFIGPEGENRHTQEGNQRTWFQVQPFCSI